MNAFGKAKYLLSIPFVYRNFWTGFLSMLGLVPRQRQVVYRLRNGLKILASGSKWDFFILNEVFVTKEYNVSLPKEPEVVVDVGANLGAATLFFANKYGKARVYSVEPFGKNFERLGKNIEANNLGNRVKAFNLALGPSRKKAPLFICEDNDGCHTLLKELNPNARRVLVEVLPLEQFMKENGISGIDLLKLDCEGAELGILRSVKDFSRIKAVVLEASAGQGEAAKKLLEERGFSVNRVKGRPLLFALRA